MITDMYECLFFFVCVSKTILGTLGVIDDYGVFTGPKPVRPSVRPSVCPFQFW